MKNEDFEFASDDALYIVDDKQNAYTVEQWKHLKKKPVARFIEYLDDDMRNDEKIIISVNWKKYEKDLSELRWANAASVLQLSADSDEKDFRDGFSNCQNLIKRVKDEKLKAFANGEDHIWNRYNDNPMFGFNIVDLPDEITKWQLYLPAVAKVNEIHESINGKSAHAYIPSIFQLSKIGKNFDYINEVLEMVGGEKLPVENADGVALKYWSSNEERVDSARYYIMHETFRCDCSTPKYVKLYVFPLFKISTK